MPLGRFAQSERAAIARKYLRGHGIEIGALGTPLPVPKSARVEYVDRLSVNDLREHYPELAGVEIVEPDVITDGERLEAIGDSTQDFVIANHFVEHCQDPIGAIRNMLRVLRPGGILYLAIPDKRFTFDVDRPLVSLDHLVRDHEEGPAWSRRQHFEEWVRWVKRIDDPVERERQVDDLSARDYSIHYHVWTQAGMFELLGFLKGCPGANFEIERFAKNGDECLFVLEKS
jgi:SAM-dependent methyltransferase